MSDSTQENDDKTEKMKKHSAVEIPSPVEIDTPDDTRKKDGNVPSGPRRRSVWFQNSFGPLGRFGTLKRKQFVEGARNLEV